MLEMFAKILCQADGLIWDSISKTKQAFYKTCATEYAFYSSPTDWPECLRKQFCEE